MSFVMRVSPSQMSCGWILKVEEEQPWAEQW